MLNKDEVLEQSKSAFSQWEPIWKENCRINGELYRSLGTSHQDLLHVGAGRTLLCIGTGPSLEKNLHLLEKYKDTKIDIACIDKALPILLEKGIKPDYVYIADAAVSYEKYCKPYIDQTKDIILMSNITAQTDWAANWQGLIFFYINKDNINSQDIFIEISGCKEVIPASSNVGNTVVVASTQIFGYDRYLLLGYDFCWSDDEAYYAGADNVKRHWMKHLNVCDNIGRLVNTSQNLFFSARWMQDFYDMMKHQGCKIYNCSGQGLLNAETRNLEKELKTAIARELTNIEKDDIIKKRMKQIIVRAEDGNEKLNQVLKECNVADIIINHIPREVLEWLKPKDLNI